MDQDERIRFGNDPLNLQATTLAANQSKKASGASEWLPENVPFRCE